MNGDSIGYRYTHSELQALFIVLQRAPQGLDLPQLEEEDWNRAIQTLESAGLVVQSEDHLIVDRLTALLIDQIAGASKVVALSSPRRNTILYRGTRLYLMADGAPGGPVSLTPFNSPEALDEALQEALPRHRPPLTVTSLNDEPVAEGLDAPNTLRATIMRRLTDA